MNVISEPFLRFPSARQRRASSAFRVLEAVVDSVWDEGGWKPEQPEDLKAAWAPTELVVDPGPAEEATQIDLDIKGAMSALLSRLPRRPSSVTRDSYSLRSRLVEAPTEEIDLPNIQEVTDGLEWLDEDDLIEL